MPFKSEAQRRKFGEMLNEKKITKKVFKEWNDATPANIPERASKKKPIGSLDELREVAKKKLGKK